jgi:hypothetical protein
VGKLRVGEPCPLLDCGRPVVARGKCVGHYGQWRRGEELRPLRTWTSNSGVCTFPDCGRDRRGRGLCGGHLAQWYEEHVKVMAAILERPLLPFEEVHHRNGVKVDNHPDNLELWNTSQPAGQRTEDKVACAMRTLELYAPEVLAQR